MTYPSHRLYTNFPFHLSGSGHKTDSSNSDLQRLRPPGRSSFHTIHPYPCPYTTPWHFHSVFQKDRIVPRPLPVLCRKFLLLILRYRLSLSRFQRNNIFWYLLHKISDIHFHPYLAVQYTLQVLPLCGYPLAHEYV